MNGRILVVEDHPLVRRGLENNLHAEGYEVTAVADANQAMLAVQNQVPDVMILDLSLVNECAFNGILDGFSLLHWLRYSVKEASFPVIIYTIDSSASVDRRAASCDVFAVVRKSENISVLLDTVRRALQSRSGQESVDVAPAESASN